jgi:multiple sugar transport system permease protein
MSTVTAPAPPAREKKPRLRSRTEGVGSLAALLLSPTFLVLGLVVGYPILSAIRLSFYGQKGVDPETGFVAETQPFVGLDNFAAMFTGGEGSRFLNALANTTFFTVVTVLLETVIGVAMALVMHKAFRGRSLIRASILIPWAIPTAISGLLWNFAFQADGVVNAFFVPGDPILWTTDAWQAKVAVIVADVWKTAPFIGLLVLAGLQVIPAEVYEAAKVDGASPWKTFWRITLPLVKPALVVAVLFRVLDVLRMFDLPYTLIGAGKQSVETVSMFSFEQAIKFNNYGLASAYALALFVYTAVVAYVFVKVLGADVIGSRAGRK